MKGHALRNNRVCAGFARLRDLVDERGSVIPAKAGIHFDLSRGLAKRKHKAEAKIKVKMDDQRSALLRSASSVRWDDGDALWRQVHPTCLLGNDPGICICIGTAIADHPP
jgi:hypothetical protein